MVERGLGEVVAVEAEAEPAAEAGEVLVEDVALSDSLPGLGRSDRRIVVSSGARTRASRTGLRRSRSRPTFLGPSAWSQRGSPGTPRNRQIRPNSSCGRRAIRDENAGSTLPDPNASKYGASCMP